MSFSVQFFNTGYTSPNFIADPDPQHCLVLWYAVTGQAGGLILCTYQSKIATRPLPPPLPRPETEQLRFSQYAAPERMQAAFKPETLWQL
jgi:hypothetical protein